MSEPSQEAKQEAEWRLVGSGFTCILVDENNRTIATNLDEASGKFIRDAHNTATAKARCDGCVDAEKECAALRKELTLANRELAEWRHAHELRKQLAHQQPGDAITVELAKRLYHQQPSAVVELTESGRKYAESKQPSPPPDGLAVASAPTTDVEKIAREYAERQTDNQFRQREIVADLLPLFAQARALDDTRLVTEWHKGFAACLEANEGNKARAYEEARAPLVAEMKAMNDRWERMQRLCETKPGDDWDEAPFLAVQIFKHEYKRAALTGTGEKECQG